MKCVYTQPFIRLASFIELVNNGEKAEFVCLFFSSSTRFLSPSYSFVIRFGCGRFPRIRKMLFIKDIRVKVTKEPYPWHINCHNIGSCFSFLIDKIINLLEIFRYSLGKEGGVVLRRKLAFPQKIRFCTGKWMFFQFSAVTDSEIRVFQLKYVSWFDIKWTTFWTRFCKNGVRV